MNIFFFAANVRVEEKQVSEYGYGDTQVVSVKQEPRDVQSETLGPAIGPSQALLDEWSRLRSQRDEMVRLNGSGLQGGQFSAISV
jgi:hypothetical protein